MIGRMAIILTVFFSSLFLALIAMAEPVTLQNLTTFRGLSGDTTWPNASSPKAPPLIVDDQLFGVVVLGVYSLPLYPAQYQVPGYVRDSTELNASSIASSGSLVRDAKTGMFYGAGELNLYGAGTEGVLYQTEFDGAHLKKVASLEKPTGVLVIEGRRLYGLDRGPEDNGRLFAVDLDQATPRVETLYTFPAGPEGRRQFPNGLILGSDGWLYGVTGYQRGVPYMAGTPSAPDTATGTVYRLDPVNPQATFEILHTFTLAQGEIPWGDYCNDLRCYGQTENEILAWLQEGPDGLLYGATSVGICSTKGVPEEPNYGNYLTRLHLCTGFEGAPDSGAQWYLSDPPYYDGPNWHGSLYRLQKDGSDFTLLHTFLGTDGSQPRGPMAVGGDGNIYGTTLGGGQSGIPESADYDPAYPDATEDSYSGTVYRLNLDQIDVDESGKVQQSGFEMLHSFVSDIDGMMPVGVSAGNPAALYGATYRRGERYVNTAGKEQKGQGTVFKVSLDPDAPQASVTVTLSSGDIQSGDTARLIWTSQYADSCTASGGADGDHWSGPREPEGYQDISPPAGTYYYTLTCESTLTGGQIGDVASLGVGAPDRTTDGNTVEYGNGAGGSQSGGMLLVVAVLGVGRRLLQPRKRRLPGSAPHAC